MIDIIKLKNIIENYYNLKISNIEKNTESTDGNVYMIDCSNIKYIIKVYTDIKHVKSIIALHNYLNANKFYVPRIITTSKDSRYVSINDKYVVVFSFLIGSQLNDIVVNGKIEDDTVRNLARELRRFHNTTSNMTIGFPDIMFASKLKRKSILHFDLTKENIFVKENQIGFIDFDDAKYGDSVCDLAITIALLFISKKRGIDIENIKQFIKYYYNGNTALMNEELPFIKKYVSSWVDYLLNNNSFDTSLKGSFEYKKEMINTINFMKFY